MLFADTGKTLTVETNATATTTEPSYSFSYIDTVPTGLVPTSGLLTGKANGGDDVGPLTGATPIVVVAAMPTDALARQIVDGVIFNRDTVSHTITVKKLSGVTGYIVAKAVLGAGESLCYDGKTWSTYTAAGEVKASALGTTSTNGTKVGSTVSVSEASSGIVHQTTLTFAATPLALADTAQGGGAKVYTFPEGRILILGSTGSIAEKTTSTILSTLNGGVTYNWGLGSTVQANGTLATTEQNILQTTNGTASAVINVAGAVSKGVGVLAPLDGTTTPIDVYLNMGIAAAGDIDADATVTVDGSVTFSWINLGDY